MSPNQIFLYRELRGPLLLASAGRPAGQKMGERSGHRRRGSSAVLAAVYTVIIALTFSTAEGGFSSLSEVARLFSNPWLLLAGWIHYLAFDLLVGTWETRDARERGISHCSSCRVWF